VFFKDTNDDMSDIVMVVARSLDEQKIPSHSHFLYNTYLGTCGELGHEYVMLIGLDVFIIPSVYDNPYQVYTWYMYCRPTGRDRRSYQRVA